MAEYENFDNFMVHRCKVEYINNSINVEFGGGYSFSADGPYPVLRRYILTFKGYQFYMKTVNRTEVLDKEKNKSINNMGALDDFYNRHLCYKTFIYNHPIYGERLVRFAEPLVIPDIIEKSHGVVEEFSVTLKEVFS